MAYGAMIQQMYIPSNEESVHNRKEDSFIEVLRKTQEKVQD
jgi:hypothetical protein